jgi:diguanylate cyclase (GGDEF)-like protein
MTLSARNSSLHCAANPQEEERLQALYHYDILDTPAEESFDRITRLARLTLQMPIATISLVDRDRQWFKSRQGMAVDETPRNISFCTHTIEKDEPFVVQDALAHRWLRHSPLVTGETHIRAYVGMPLRTPGGHNIGALCVMDVKAREIGKEQLNVLQDLARLVVDELELRQLAFIDPLTGAMTRRAFLAEAEKEVKRAKRHHRDLVCIMFDIDHFKSTNDAYGHACGDQVLAKVLAACREQLRTSDHIGRLGGEEFAILLPEIGGEAVEVAEKLRRRIASLVVDYGSQIIQASASFGVAILVDQDTSFADISARADTALYEAKNSGRNKVCAGKPQATA